MVTRLVFLIAIELSMLVAKVRYKLGDPVITYKLKLVHAQTVLATMAVMDVIMESAVAGYVN